MAITKVGDIGTIPSPISDWTNAVKHINAFINQVNNQAFILSDPLGTTSPVIKQGCYINHGGTLYIVDTEDYTPSGSPADGNVYIKLTPSGDTLVGLFITDISSYSFNQQYGNMVSGDDMILPYLLVKSGTSWTKYRYQPMSASFGAVKATTVDTGYGANEIYKQTFAAVNYTGTGSKIYTITDMIVNEIKYISLYYDAEGEGIYLSIKFPDDGTYQLISTGTLKDRNKIWNGGISLALSYTSTSDIISAGAIVIRIS